MAFIETKPGELDAVCDDCGKPLTVSNEFGLFCEDQCGLEESRHAKNKLKEIIDLFSENFKED